MLYPTIVLENYENKGFGIYTTEKIPAGSVIWLPCKNCISYDASYFSNMSEEEVQYVEDKAYYMTNGDLLMPCSIGRFMNHSCSANILEYGLDFGVAVRDIEAGEEITSDYRRWLNDKPWEMKCYCGTETCIGMVSPQMGYDEKLQAFWYERIKSVLPLVGKVTQPLHDIAMDCSHIYKDIVTNQFDYSFPCDDSITIRRPKYLVYLSSKELYDEMVEDAKPEEAAIAA